MSLTRKEWEMVWSATKWLEQFVNRPIRSIKKADRAIAQEQIDFLKGKVEQVIGQME